MSTGGEPRRSPATALSLLALVVAISGGSAYAGSQLSKGESSANPKALTVQSAKNVKASSKPSIEAPSYKLFERGPFKVTAKCVSNPPSVFGYLYVDVTKNGSVGQINGAMYDGDPFYIPKAKLEVENIQTGSAAGVSAVNTFLGINGKTVTQLTMNVFVKEGTPLEGDGTYGNGNRCIFQLTETGTG